MLFKYKKLFNRYKLEDICAANLIHILEYASDSNNYHNIMSLSRNIYNYFIKDNKLLTLTYLKRLPRYNREYFTQYVKEHTAVKYMIVDDRKCYYDNKYHDDKGHLTIDLDEIFDANADKRIVRINPNFRCIKRTLYSSNNGVPIFEYLNFNRSGFVYDRKIMIPRLKISQSAIKYKSKILNVAIDTDLIISDTNNYTIKIIRVSINDNEKSVVYGVTPGYGYRNIYLLRNYDITGLINYSKRFISKNIEELKNRIMDRYSIFY
jgi:hypothetical protein